MRGETLNNGNSYACGPVKARGWQWAMLHAAQVSHWQFTEGQPAA